MKKRMIMVIIMTAAVLGLTACGKGAGTKPADTSVADESKTGEAGDENASDKEQAADTTDTLSPEKESTEAADQDAQSAESIEYVFPEDQASDWQKAYHEKLYELRDIQAANLDADDPLKIVDSYFLYDIDDSGTPELYVKFGDCEAAYTMIVYSYDEGKVNELDDTINAGHSSFYTTPDQGLMVYWGHMASEFVQLATLEDGKFVYQTISERGFMDDPDEDYTPAEELVSGAKYIVLHQSNLDLPIMMYGQTSYSTATGQSEDEVKSILQKAYQENGNIYGVSGDGYGGDTGMINFTEYCQPGKIYEYMDNPASVAEEQWVDLNQDGQVECVLKMQEEGSDNVNYVMLSLQNDTVYAYSFHYWSGDAVFQENGTFDYEYSYYNRIIFDKDQCYAAKE